MPVLFSTQDPSTNAQVQALQAQEASLVKQLATAEAALKRYEKESSAMSSAERELDVGVRQNRAGKVMGLRGELDATRQKIADAKAGIPTNADQAIVRVTDGPLIVQDAPITMGTVEAPHFFGLEPRQFREPALFILLCCRSSLRPHAGSGDGRRLAPIAKTPSKAAPRSTGSSRRSRPLPSKSRGSAKPSGSRRS